MDNQKTTSKTSLLNSLLIKAWKERWTDSQWGINIKTVLPRGVSGDVYNLADCILQQALVGPKVNMLVLSYLRHSLCSHLISHAAVLKRISKYDGYDRHHCILVLLNFLDSFINSVTCRGKPEESVLANALLSLLHWLMQIYSAGLTEMHINKTVSEEQQEVLDKTIKIMEKIMANQFLIGVLLVGHQEDQELSGQIIKKYTEINTLIESTEYQPTNSGFLDILQSMSCLNIENLEVLKFVPKTVEPITYCLQPLLAVKVLLKPSSDTQVYVVELLMIQRVKEFTFPRLYSEVIRACLISLHNVSGTNKESMWCAFTFIKVPHILKQLNQLSKDYDEKLDYSPDVVNAFELLLEDSPILDMMDTKCACNTIKCLLDEMLKQRLVNEKHIVHFSGKRDTITSSLQKLDLNHTQPSIVKFVIRAEPPLTGILKTLNSDYNKVQEALLEMLCQVLSGNSFELILSVATVEGKLKTFVSRLIKCNELSKQLPVETGKPVMTRSALFDVSFLMLCFIVQTYGANVVLDEVGDSFFEKWVRECMVERVKCKSPMNMVKMCDQAKVDELLSYLNSSDGSKKCTLKWHEICLTIPGMLYQVLMAWEYDTLSATDVKNILDSMKMRLCSYSVCASSWLCAYMQIVRQDDLLKPMNMVQQFLTPFTNDEISQQEMFKERLVLTSQIIRKMQHDFHPIPKIRAMMLPQNVVSPLPMDEQFVEVWKSITEHGWLPIDSAIILESLLQSSCSRWLVTKLVDKILQCKYLKDMNKTMDLVFAIMHLDIERCTIAFLSQILPILLLNKIHSSKIVEPHLSVLARLCVYCMLSTMESPAQPSKKRSRSDIEDIENLCTNTKIRKLNMDHSGDSSSSDYFTENIITREPPTTVREPLQKCLQKLFKIFSQCLVNDGTSPEVYFIFHFLSLLVQCGKDRVKPVLKLLPQGMVQNLLKLVITDEVTVGFILRLYDLNTASGRQSAISDLSLYHNIQLKKDSIKL